VIWNIGTKSHFSYASASAAGLSRQKRPTRRITLRRASGILPALWPGLTRRKCWGHTSATKRDGAIRGFWRAL